MTPDNIVIVLKDSPNNSTEGVESTYFAQRLERTNEEGELIEPFNQVFFKKSDLPIELQNKLDDTFADVLTFLATY